MITIFILLGDIRVANVQLTSFQVHHQIFKGRVLSSKITTNHNLSWKLVTFIFSVFSSRYKQWRMLTRMNQARERHGSACVDGHIYVVGGLMAGKQKRKPGVLSEVERFNPRTQYWENVESLPRRCYSPGVINYKNKLYVIGGVSMTDDSSTKNANSTQSKVLLDLVQGIIMILKFLAKFQAEKNFRKIFKKITFSQKLL